MSSLSVEDVAAEFHETYEALAPKFGYATRPESAVTWERVPEANRRLMIAVVHDLIQRGIIVVPL